MRTAAFMGYRVIAAMAGLSVEHDDRWRGYLANIARYEEETGRAAEVFNGSGPGLSAHVSSCLP